MVEPRIPSATYRLQFNHQFTFKQAIDLVDYLHDLGISDLYASPIFKASSHSLHGYDVIDSSCIHPEIGTDEELNLLATRLKQNGMGLILDIVPNHMCISDPGNHWWQDLLENGPSSIFAPYFDIVWDPPKHELKNKVLLPILSQPLGKTIESQECMICYQEGAFSLFCEGKRFPLNPKTYPMILKSAAQQILADLGGFHPDYLEMETILNSLDHLPDASECDPHKRKERHHEKERLKKSISVLLEKSPLIYQSIQASIAHINGVSGDPRSFDRLEELLRAQSYRLSYWRLTNDWINYRRFFDINDLACLHMENEEVFEAVHAQIFRFIEKGWVSGLRIDHIDGLYNPQGYLKKLRERSGALYTIVEKILVGEEQLNAHWMIAGTTGYDYLNLVNGLFVVHEHHYQMQQIYDQFIGHHQMLSDIVYACKKEILTRSMSSELSILTGYLEEICAQHRLSSDYASASLKDALREIVACFPVYRAYINMQSHRPVEQDRAVICEAVEKAKRLNRASDHLVFDFIKSILLLDDPIGLTEEQTTYRRKFILHLQQMTGPVMAKGFEDTALYRAYPLLSLNEVGMDSKLFGVSINEYHAANLQRSKKWPHSLLTTMTHDTKRSEDARSRINVLSEKPHEWKEALHLWRHLNKEKKVELPHAVVPDWNEEVLLYQTLIGIWPSALIDPSDQMNLARRIKQYFIKALKEAKIHTSWINPHQDYEEAAAEFVDRILDPSPENRFIHEFELFMQPIIRAGMANSLSQLLLKMTSPGVVDFYQGSELGVFTLVDPDNRQPVDYAIRQSQLQWIKDEADSDLLKLIHILISTLDDGRLKLFLIWRVLNYRKSRELLFQRGEYHPLAVQGEKERHLIAFSRRQGKQEAIIIASRFYTQWADLKSELPLGDDWGDTAIRFSEPLNGWYKNVITGEEFETKDWHSLSISKVLTHLPFALLDSISREQI
ncbi:MAG: malto-oligosyltrehalose synthase [Chlamydiales bacterium]